MNTSLTMFSPKPEPGYSYRSTKTFGHDLGLSCCFRQWRADHSHCQFLHGYALKVHFEFTAGSLDARNWVMDFGNLKSVKEYLQNLLDHTTLVATDDPKISIFRELAVAKLIQLREVPAVGCEALSRIIYEVVAFWLKENQPKVRLISCEVHEHGANSASYGYGGPNG